MEPIAIAILLVGLSALLVASFSPNEKRDNGAAQHGGWLGAAIALIVVLLASAAVYTLLRAGREAPALPQYAETKP
jgi:hypothetical protein